MCNCTMQKAIDRLEAMKAEYEQSLKAFGEPQGFYDRLRAKADALEEAISALRQIEHGQP